MLVSCSKTGTAKGKKYTIGVSIQGSNNDWASSCYAHFKYAFGTKYADRVANVYYGESGYDDKKQIADIEDLLTKKLDLLVVQPVSETSAAGVIEKAKAEITDDEAESLTQRMKKGELTLEAAIQKIKTETHRFIRHQYAWFRPADEKIHWFDIGQGNDSEIEKTLAEFLKSE